jgi:hypothetical protein
MIKLNTKIKIIIATSATENKRIMTKHLCLDHYNLHFYPLNEKPIFFFKNYIKLKLNNFKHKQNINKTINK